MASKHLIVVDLETKNEIYRDYDKIKNFKLSGPFEKVALVEKVWFNGLIDWLQSQTIPPPGRIRVSKLFEDKKFDPTLQLHTDFEILDLDTWEKLNKIFGCNAKLLKFCRRHPKTKKLTILIQPIILTFSIVTNKENGEEIIKEVVDKKWKISMIKDYIGKKYKIDDISECALYQNDEEIPISNTCGEVYDNDKSQITIHKKIFQARVFENITDKYSRYPLQKNINNLPLPIEAKQQSKNTKKSSQISNTSRPNSSRNKNGFENRYKTYNNEQSDSDSDSYEYTDSPPLIIKKKPISRLGGISSNNNTKIIKPAAINSQTSPLNSPSQSKNSNDILYQNGVNMIPLSNKSKKDEKMDNEDIVISRSNKNYQRSKSLSNFPKPYGLRNLGNTCFFNAAVQCLIRCEPLTQFILSSQCISQINMKNPLGTKGRIVSAYRDLLQKMTTSSEPDHSQSSYLNSSRYTRYSSSPLRYSHYSSAISPSGLHSAISQQYPIFEDFSQNDAQELVGSLLDGLHEDLNQSYQAKGNESPVQLSKDPDSWELYLSKNSSPIMDIFNGKLFRCIKCPLCGHKRLVFDPFMFLSLPIPSSSSSPVRNYTSSFSRYSSSSSLYSNYSNNEYYSNRSYSQKVDLTKCFESFTKSETLDSHNLWKCDNCRKEVRATVNSGIAKVSDVLIIHLKRFEGQSYYMKKIDTPVDYPDTLDSSFFQNSMNLSSSGNQNGSSVKYNLIGVVFHHGTLLGGHYTAAALDPATKEWYEYNDSSVTKIQKEDAHSSKAYILFYQKC